MTTQTSLHAYIDFLGLSPVERIRSNEWNSMINILITYFPKEINTSNYMWIYLPDAYNKTTISLIKPTDQLFNISCSKAFASFLVTP